MRSSEPIADRLPPYFPDYKDRGCELSLSCLECPLPHCRYDNIYASGWGKFRLRSEEISIRHQKGETIAVLAKRFRLHERTIQRITARQRK